MGNTDVPNAIYDRTDPGGTYRPDELPVPTCGIEFNPINIPSREPILSSNLPEKAIDIFKLFVPESLVEC